MTGNKDTTGKLFIQECLEVAKTKGEGWTTYMYPKNGASSIACPARTSWFPRAFSSRQRNPKGL